MQTLEQLFETALEYAKHMLVGDRSGAVIPTFWIQLDPGPSEMIAAPWDDEAENLMTLTMIRAKLHSPRARSYAFASEAWVATESLSKPSGLMPCEHPDRREVVLIEAFERDGKGGTRVYAIKRNRKGVVTALERDGEINDAFRGRMHNLFRSQAERDADDLPDPIIRRDKSVGAAVTTRTPLNHCLDCGHAIDASMPTPDHPNNSTPGPGDLAICLHCAHVMIYADDLTVRAPTDVEVVEIAGDPDMVRAVNAIAQFNKEHPRT